MDRKATEELNVQLMDETKHVIYKLWYRKGKHNTTSIAISRQISKQIVERSLKQTWKIFLQTKEFTSKTRI